MSTPQTEPGVPVDAAADGAGRNRRAGVGVVVAVGVLIAAALLAGLLWLRGGKADAPAAAQSAPAAEPELPANRVRLMPAPANADLVRRLDRLEAQAGALEETLDASRNEWARAATDARALRLEVDGIAAQVAALAQPQPQPQAGAGTGGMPADLDALRAALDTVAKRLAGVDWLARENHRALKARASAAAELPFAATAIDWWNGEPSVVVRAAGETRFVAPGDTVAGWRLAEVDDTGTRAVFVRGERRAALEIPQ